MTARQEDFVYAEHVLRRGFATEDQVQECLQLLDRMRGELQLEETLENILLKKGYLAPAQATVIEQAINPTAAGSAKNQIEGYQLLTRLGSGAMGSVYKAHHLKLDIPVALKVLRVDLAKSKTQIERLKREAQLAARLNHVNIVRSLDVGESNGFHYFAMEYVDGATVRQHLQRGRLRERDALRIIRDAARALEHAHEQGVVHRDVKPANIILTRESVVKLADFGLARGKEPSELTLEQASIGTPQYLAPEQARRAADATARSDLFSLGATLYHMVTGRPPFSGGNLGEIFQKVLACEFDPPESIVPDLGIDTVYLIHRMMRAHPRQRYASATELLADLDRVEQGERVAPPDFKGDYQAYLRRRRIRNALIGLAAAVVIVAASIYTTRAIRAQRIERARVAACSAANRTGSGERENPDTVAELKALLARLERARAAESCRDAEIRDLLQLIREVKGDVVLLEEAETCLAGAQQEGAAFRALHRRLDGIWPRFRLPGPRLAAERIRDRIAELSAAAARRHYRTVFKTPYETPAQALAALQGFAADVQGRYLELVAEVDFRPHDVAAQAQALESLIAAWTAAERTYGPTYDDNLAAHRYASAHATLAYLEVEKQEALKEAGRRGLTSPIFLGLFPKENRAYALELAERTYFKETIRDEADQALDAHDPGRAAALVRAFEPEAKATQYEVRMLLDRIESREGEWRAQETAALVTLEESVRRSLRDRQWGAVWSLVATQYEERAWLPSMRLRLEAVYGRAEAYRALLERFTANARAAGLAEPSEGDPDAFLAPDGSTFTLASVPGGRARLASLLAFDDQRPRDIELRGFFLLGESFVERDPREELRLVSEAIRDLNRAGKPIVVRLREREKELEGVLQLREQRAEEVHAQLRQAIDRRDYSTALQHLGTLLSGTREGLRRTNFVDRVHEGLVQRKEELVRRGGVELLRLRAGLPRRPESWREDIEGDQIFIRFDFREWWPDEGEVEEELKDKRAREFWNKFFEREEYPEAEWDTLFLRAKHQLLWFDGNLVADPGRGGAVLAGREDENRLHWQRGEHDAIRVVTLHNPLRPDRDWSIELTVGWDADEGARPGVPGADGYPVYFALTAGQLQAGFVATPIRSGGGFGARLFRQESLFDGLERKDLFYPFHIRFRDGRHRRRLPSGGELAYFDQFQAGKVYRLRLERRERSLRFHAAPLDDWRERGGFDTERDLFLEKRFSKEELAAAATLGDGRRVFRILSLTRCRIGEVVLEGVLMRYAVEDA